MSFPGIGGGCVAPGLRKVSSVVPCTQDALPMKDCDNKRCGPAAAHRHETTGCKVLQMRSPAAETSQHSCAAWRRQATRQAALNLGPSANM